MWRCNAGHTSMGMTPPSVAEPASMLIGFGDVDRKQSLAKPLHHEGRLGLSRLAVVMCSNGGASGFHDVHYSALTKNGKYRIVGINCDARTELRVYEEATGTLVKLCDLPGAAVWLSARYLTKR